MTAGPLAKSKRAAAEPTTLLRVGGYGAFAFGVALVVAALLAASSAPPPLTVVITLTGVLQLGIGRGLLRRPRAAWAPGVSLAGVLAVVGLLALPALARAGVPMVAAIGGTVAAALLFGVLVAGRREL